MFQLGTGVTIILEKNVNIKRGWEYAGGKIIVTDSRVVLRPHKLNISREPESFLLENITGVETYNQFGIVPTGIKISVAGRDPVKLVVWGRSEVIAALSQNRSETPAGSGAGGGA